MKKLTPEDSALIDKIFENRKTLFVQLCQGKINEQTMMNKDDECLAGLRDILEKYQPQI